MINANQCVANRLRAPQNVFPSSSAVALHRCVEFGLVMAGIDLASYVWFRGDFAKYKAQILLKQDISAYEPRK